MVPLPSVFISHGSPMHALEAGAAGLAWAALGKRLGKPKAILVSSAHWETNLPMVTGSDRPATIHAPDSSRCDNQTAVLLPPPSMPRTWGRLST